MYVLMARRWNVPISRIFFLTKTRAYGLTMKFNQKKKLAKKWKNQINGMENGLEKSKNVTKIVVD